MTTSDGNDRTHAPAHAHSLSYMGLKMTSEVLKGFKILRSNDIYLSREREKRETRLEANDLLSVGNRDIISLWVYPHFRPLHRLRCHHHNGCRLWCRRRRPGCPCRRHNCRYRRRRRRHFFFKFRRSSLIITGIFRKFC